MPISIWLVFAYITFGIAGVYLFRAGKKNSRPAFLLIGLALMIYPYFVEGAFMNWLIGGALLGSAYLLR